MVGAAERDSESSFRPRLESAGGVGEEILSGVGVTVSVCEQSLGGGIRKKSMGFDVEYICVYVNNCGVV